MRANMKRSKYDALRAGVRKSLLMGATATIALSSPIVHAQDQGSNRATNVLVEEVIVTGTKRAGGEALQSAPVAVTAYSGEVLDALFVTDIQSLSYSMPNVQLEDIGTIPGTANFSIRGVAVNSSIPSIDPAVALVYDDIPLAINTGVIFDTFDLEAVEVFRGPQGTLFGRNATAGAVVLRTSDPSDELTVKAKFGAESGSLYRTSAVLSGPLSDTFSAKIGVLFEDDGGYFDNTSPVLSDPSLAPFGVGAAIKSDIGARSTTVFRPAIKWAPTDEFELVAKYESGSTDGQGNPAQNRGLNGDEFETSINAFGEFDSEWSQFTNEMNWDIAFGEGTVTSITGWREYDNTSEGDIDASPLTIFHSFSKTDHEQLSSELRYSGRFNNVGLTAGLFYMDQELSYIEDREIPSAPLPFIGGGIQDVTSKGIFAEADIDLSDTTTLIVGGRFSDEDKYGQVERIFSSNDCTRELCSNYDVQLGTEFSEFTPRLGLRYQPSDTWQSYVSYTEGVRSGGFNFRNTSPTAPLAAFDIESVKSFEIGTKAKFFDNKLRVNAAIFNMTLDNLQREVNRADPVAGVVQEITNTADATVQGLEAEFLWAATDNLVITGQLGITSGEYDAVRFDISGDGVVDAGDLALELPRLAPRTYGIGAVYDRDISNGGTLTFQGNYNYRAQAAYTDSNLGTLPEFNALDGSIAYRMPNEKVKISVFAKNLLDEISFGNDTQLPPNFAGSSVFPIPGLQGTGATFSPLNKGRILGLEIQYDY